MSTAVATRPSRPAHTKPETASLSEEPARVETTHAVARADQQHQEVINLIKGNCLEMSFTVHGLPKSRRITGKSADTVASSVGGKRRGIRSSWSMFSSEHPAVKELSVAIRELEQLRDTWTIVRSAEARRGDSGQVSVEPGKRLIWAADVDEFYKQFVRRAKLIDLAAEKLHFAIDNETRDDKGNVIRSIKAIDRDNAGEAWDEKAYPVDVRLTVGVAKEREVNGQATLGEDGEPKYIINFHEYRVSEKLTGVLQKRAEERLDAAMSGTIETAMAAVVNELTDDMATFMNELTPKVGVFPRKGSEYEYLTAHGEAEILKTVDRNKDLAIPVGQVKALVRYKAKESEEEDAEIVSVTKWFGPMSEASYHEKFAPQSTGERKKIYPTVIEGLIAKLQAFRDRKAKMLGQYGEATIAAFQPLLETLTQYRGIGGSNEDAAKKLASDLKGSETSRMRVGQAIADVIERLSDKVGEVKVITGRRRQVKASLIGKL